MVRNPRVHSSSVLRPYNTDFSTPTTTARTVRAKRHSNFGTLRCPPSTPTISFGVASERSSSTKFRPRPCLFQTLATIAAIYTSGWWIPRSGALGTVAVSTCRRQSCGTSSLLALAHPRSASHWHYRQQQQNNHCETRPFYSPSPATPRRQHSSSRSSKSMALFATQRDRSGTITVSPKQESEQSALVVIAHGLGDTAEGFADVAEVRTLHWGVGCHNL